MKVRERYKMSRACVSEKENNLKEREKEEQLQKRESFIRRTTSTNSTGVSRI